MELARVTSKGQITIPAETRKKLHLKPGDRVLFIEENDRRTAMSSSLAASTTVQRELANEAKRNRITCRLVRGVMEISERPTAWLCTHDTMAIGAMEAYRDL